MSRKRSNEAIVDVPRKLKLAFIGGAFDSAVGRSHRIAVEMDQWFELVAGCFSRDAAKSRESAIKYGVEPDRAYSNVRSLIEAERGQIDAVVVLSPQDQHFEHVAACIRADIPVICEKALVCSPAEAHGIQTLLAERDGYLVVTYNYTGYPMIRELKDMIAAGALGKVQQIHLEMPQEGFARLSPEGVPIVPQEWRLRDSVIPTVSLDLGVHLHMMVRFLTNLNPVEVVATSTSRGNFPGVIDNVHCLARYSGNMDCSLWYGKTAFGNRNGLRLRVFGSNGAAEWVQENPEYLSYADNCGGKFCLDRTSNTTRIANQVRYQRFKAGHPAGFIEAFANYYADVADDLREYLGGQRNRRRQYVFGIDESLEGLQMLAAIARSSSTGQWETLE